MMANTFIIYVQFVSIIFIKTDEVQIPLRASQCGFHPFDGN